MPRYLRYGGNVIPNVPPSAPLALRLPAEVYALDGLGADYIVAPGARLEVGPHGKLYETLGEVPATQKILGIALVGLVAYIALKVKK